MIKINFILPFFCIKPGGGTKIMFEYANRLAAQGYDVCVYHTNSLPYLKSRFPVALKWIKNTILYPKAKPTWFDFHDEVKTKHIKIISDETIRDAEVTIGTWWSVAFEINKLNNFKGKKINLIQGYEVWIGHEDLVKKSYTLDIIHIVIADYLEEIVFKESGVHLKKIYNAIDNNKFFINKKIQERNPFTVMMLYSEEEHKGTQFGLQALRKLKNKFPLLQVTLFGTYKKTANLESWISYYSNPNNLVELYNDNAIFLTVSLLEGWDLPACEAMFSGCALIATDIEGHASYAVKEKTALLIEPKNVPDTVDKITELLENQALRIQLATIGNEYVQKFKWENNIQELIKIIDEI
jgi:glycosyltransferase involved in cell wall biosynthesis